VPEQKFRLPRSSYEQVTRIIQAYENFPDGARLDEVAKVAVAEPEIISRNNGFLQDVGVIGGGNKKALTEPGRRLARALEYDQEEDVKQTWRAIISDTDFLRSVLSAVRIRRGMDASTLQTHIAYSAALPKNPRVMTGAACVIEILQVADLLRDEDGRLIAVPAEDVESRSVSVVRSEPIDVPESAPPPSKAQEIGSVEASIQIIVEVRALRQSWTM
jgi:hypothetical protein